MAKSKKSKKSKSRSLHVRAYKRVARKHPILAPFVWLAMVVPTLGGRLTWTGLKWTGIGTARGARWAAPRVAGKVRADLQRRKWVEQAPPPTSGQRWWQRREHYRCCGEEFTSADTLNAFMLANYRDQPRSAVKAKPVIQHGTTAKTAGKVFVLGAERSGGRHRTRHKLPGARSVDDLVRHYRKHFTAIGASIMSIDSITRRLRQAAAAFGDIPRPKDLAELRAICVDMERAMGTLSESIDQFAVTLKRSEEAGGANILPELVNPFMARAREYADACGREYTKFIAAFEVFYGPAIRLAANGTMIPAMDLSKTG